MSRPRRRVFMTAGYNTVALGPGREEFHPGKPRPGIEHYMKEAGKAVLSRIGGAEQIDECVVGNFMAARFNRQGNLAALFPSIDPGLLGKPAVRVEGACASGGLALLTGIRSVLAETAEVVLVIGVEVQNTVKPIYGADILAGAGWYRERKSGHAYFFPGQFSDRAGCYFKKYGREKTRQAFARWYRHAVENARLCPTAQEYHNRSEDLEALALTEPDPEGFLEHLNVYDCSKVSDAASALVVASEEGLKRLEVPGKDTVEVLSWAQAVADLTQPPPDMTILDLTPAQLEARLKPLRYSNQRAKDCLEWSPRYDWKEGLERAHSAPSSLLSVS